MRAESKIDAHDPVNVDPYPEDAPSGRLTVDSEAEPATVTVYVPLAVEAVDVFRPAIATLEGGTRYRLPRSEPEGEQRMFPVGAVVRCEPRTLHDGRHLVAVATV